MSQNVIVITKKQATYGAIFLMAFVYVIPIILMNEYYKDDLEVVMHGGAYGIEHARPIKDILLYILNFSTQLSDVRPLPIIFASMMAAFSAIILSQRFSPDNLFLGASSGLLLFLNPFYIEDLFFGFDSFTITFSVLLVILPFSKKISILEIKYRLLVSFALYLSVLLTYQATISLVLVLIFVEYTLGLYEKKRLSTIVKDMLINLLALGVALFIYTFIIAPLMLTMLYATEKSGFGASLLDNFLINNLLFSELFLDLIRSNFFIPTLPIIFVGYIAFIRWTNSYLKTHYTEFHLLLRFIAIMSPLILMVISLGPLLLLKNSVISPRVLIGFGGFLFAFFIIFSQTFKERRIISKLIFIPIFYYFVFMINVCNVQKENMKGQYATISHMYNDITKHIDLHEIDAVSTYGVYTNSPLIFLNGIEVNPLLGKIVSNTLYGPWEAVGLYQSLLRLGLKKPYITKEHAIVNKIKPDFCKTTEPVVKTSEYNIYVIDRVILIDLDLLCLKRPKSDETTRQGDLLYR